MGRGRGRRGREAVPRLLVLGGGPAPLQGADDLRDLGLEPEVEEPVGLVEDQPADPPGLEAGGVLEVVEEAAGRGDEQGDALAEAGLLGGAGLAACFFFFFFWKSRERRGRAVRTGARFLVSKREKGK